MGCNLFASIGEASELHPITRTRQSRTRPYFDSLF